MKMRTWSLAALVVLSLGCSDDSEPEETTGELQQNATDQLIAALGGRDNLDRLTGLSIAGTGTRYLPDEGVRPGDEPIEANTFERRVSIDIGADALRVDTSRDIQFLFPGSQMYSDIVRQNLGASTQPFFGMPLGALSSDKVASIRRQELLLTPHLLLREFDLSALQMESDVMLEGVAHHRLIADEGPAPITLFVNAESGVLSKLETLEHDFYQRDVTLEVLFSDWVRAGELSFPRGLSVVRHGQTLFDETVNAVTVNPTFDATTFEFPPGVTPTYDAELYARGELSHQWYYLLDSIGLPFSGVDTSITPVEVGPNVLQLVGGSHHSFVVRQAGGLVLVDAPLYEDRGDALVDALEREFPGVPITYVVASHFHLDHVSGIREVLGRSNASLVVHESVESFWRDILSAPSTLRPDALARSPRNVPILTVPENGERTLEDAENQVAIYHLPTSHAADMLLTHEVSSNSVFVVDIYSPGNATQFGAGDLDAALTAYAIPSADLKIVGGHGGRIDDYAALQAAVMAGTAP